MYGIKDSYFLGQIWGRSFFFVLYVIKSIKRVWSHDAWFMDLVGFGLHRFCVINGQNRLCCSMEWLLLSYLWIIKVSMQGIFNFSRFYPAVWFCFELVQTWTRCVVSKYILGTWYEGHAIIYPLSIPVRKTVWQNKHWTVRTDNSAISSISVSLSLSLSLSDMATLWCWLFIKKLTMGPGLRTVPFCIGLDTKEINKSQIVL